MSVSESGFKVLMCESLTNEIGITTHCHLQGRICMAETMKGYSFVNLGCLNPVFEWFGSQGLLKSYKYLSCLSLTKQLDSVLTERESGRSLRFLSFQDNA